MFLHLAASGPCVNMHTCWQKLWLHTDWVYVCMNSPCAYFCGRWWNVADHWTVPGVCLGHTSKALTHILHSPRGECCKALGGCWFCMQNEHSLKERNELFSLSTDLTHMIILRSWNYCKCLFLSLSIIYLLDLVILLRSVSGGFFSIRSLWTGHIAQ